MYLTDLDAGPGLMPVSGSHLASHLRLAWHSSWQCVTESPASWHPARHRVIRKELWAETGFCFAPVWVNMTIMTIIITPQSHPVSPQHTNHLISAPAPATESLWHCVPEPDHLWDATIIPETDHNHQPIETGRDSEREMMQQTISWLLLLSPGSSGHFWYGSTDGEHRADHSPRVIIKTATAAHTSPVIWYGHSNSVL